MTMVSFVPPKLFVDAHSDAIQMGSPRTSPATFLRIQTSSLLRQDLSKKWAPTFVVFALRAVTTPDFQMRQKPAMVRQPTWA
jgi:hypothetical protein